MDVINTFMAMENVIKKKVFFSLKENKREEQILIHFILQTICFHQSVLQ